MVTVEVIAVTHEGESRSVGVLLLSAHGARLAEWDDGKFDDLDRFELSRPDDRERDLRGPAHARPRGAPGAAPGVRSTQQRDLHRRRLERHHVAEVERIAGHAVVGALERGWRGVLVCGNPRLTHPAASVLRARQVAVAEDPRIVDRLSPHELGLELAAPVGELLEQTRRRRSTRV
jgi:hypothetical protein